MMDYDWAYYEDDTTDMGGHWHTKAYALRRNGVRQGDPTITVGYDAAPDVGPDTDTTDGYTVTVSRGEWTDLTKDSEGFVEGLQTLGEQDPLATIGTYDTETEAQTAMAAFMAAMAGDLRELGDRWGQGSDAALPTPHKDAREAYQANADAIQEAMPGHPHLA